ncbi:Oxysterol-binding protein [Hyphopichia burtonii NRRL Y-1933]|uniref:Oxysterol-binding protein n=1 Tax=Hyphopichia burtonii NRRL Y-1933 TaxID=984485 RepID=A0A1E4RDG5_9ASCO|nr:Oxysterol-binding protein [Hyphopichia burtonii NRRL Y-1933]ODV65273.1 Oxysterol-binding protein [Hyphopichia burtonii NRRL Y-1933]
MVLNSLSKLKLKKTNSEEGKEDEPVTSQSTDDVDEIDSENQSILLGIISQLRPGCDLTKITLPTFILEKKSMLERITNAFFTPQILLEANDTEDDVERFLLIVKWYLSCWHIAPKAVKKPLNPILGEVFGCYWDDLPGGNTSYYLSEQTSHHPPESSYFYIVPEKKITADGVIIPRSKFLGNSSAAMMEGLACLTLGERNNEKYTMTQPNMYCRGILFGKLRYELGDHMIIKCEDTGLEADIEFKTKGFIGGNYDAIEGTIFNSKTSEQLYTISGKWNEVMEIEGKDTKKSTFYDTSKAVIYKPKVKLLEKQDHFESRKLWHKTITALDERDHEAATEEKFKVEEEQRIRAKERLEKGEEFKPKLFKASGQKAIPFVVKEDFDLDDSPETNTEKLLSLFPLK